jgi:nucleoid DNA-binding protein
MTKRELVQRISRDCRMTRRVASRALHSIGRNLAAGIRREGRVHFSGLGTFSATRGRSDSLRPPGPVHRLRLRRRAVQFTPSRNLRRGIR